jgi:Tol biopolymer transport system component
MTLLGLVAASGSAQAQIPGPNGRIAFARQITPAIHDQGHVVYTVNPDGSHLQGPADYSPGGSRLLVVAPAGDDQKGLFVIKLDGTGLHRIPTGDVVPDGDSEGVSWSPSGNHILFSANPDPDHRRAIFVVNVDGTGLRQIPIPGWGGVFSAANPIACFGPSWSPEGTRLDFVRVRAGFNVQNIYTANADGSGLSRVTHQSSGLEVTDPDWGRTRWRNS